LTAEAALGCCDGIRAAPLVGQIHWRPLQVSESRRNEPKKVESPASAPQSAQAGRVTHDSRGNAVWNWAIDTDVTTSTGLLRALAPATGPLSLEGESSSGSSPVKSWAGDPYNRSR